MNSQYRPELTTMPARIAKLPVFRGYPVPWFVQWMPRTPETDGPDIPGGPAGQVPEFRLMDGEKLGRAVSEKKCWVCGERLYKSFAFVVGPMCALNRISAEPPSHHECAEWSIKNCPFLTKPHMVRREAGMPEGVVHADGYIGRNPGVMLVWTTDKYKLKPNGESVLFEMGFSIRMDWYTVGRPATVQEIESAIAAGLDNLKKTYDDLSPGECDEIEQRRVLLMTTLREQFPTTDVKGLNHADEFTSRTAAKPPAIARV